MLKIIFLGTSGSTPTKERSMPSVAIEKEGEIYLFDCGEGAQMQAMKYGVNISKIKAIFITHTHGDHIIGLAGLVRTMALNKNQKELRIFVPMHEEQKILSLLTFDKALLDYPIIIEGIKSGIVYKGDDFEVSAFKLNHRVPTFGYVFKERDKTRFIKEKCHKLGIKGTMFSVLMKNGSIKVKGRTVKLKEVTYMVKGRKIVYATDTRPTKSTENAAKDADILIHETSYSFQLKKLAKERYHCTAKEAAMIAKKAKCKKLILFHPSARYRDTAILVKEAKETFINSEMAKDGMRITL